MPHVAPTVPAMAAGTFMGVVAAFFLGTYPIVNVILRGVTEIALLQLGDRLLDQMTGLALPHIPPQVLAQAAAVGIVVLLASVLLGIGGRSSLLLARIITGFAASFAVTAVLLTTFLALPEENLSLPSLLPVLVAAAGVCIILAAALERAAQPQ